MVLIVSDTEKDRLQRKKTRREKRLQRFETYREQTLKNQTCHGCYWISISFGQSPCKSCSRFDNTRLQDKFKSKK